MISQLMRFPTDPVTLAQLPTLNTFLLSTDFADHELDLICDTLDTAEDHLVTLEGIHQVILSAPYHTKEEVALSLELINGITSQYSLLVTKDDLYQARGGKYYPSMEGITFTWKEIWRFVKKITAAIVDGVRSFFNKRFTFIGRAYQQTVKIEKTFKEYQLDNYDQILKMKIQPPLKVSDLTAENGDQLMHLQGMVEAMKTQKVLLNPKGYRDALESYVRTLSGFSAQSNEDLLKIAHMARENVILHVAQYLELTEGYNDGKFEGKLSDRLMGSYYFQMKYPLDSLAAPNVYLKREDQRLRFKEIDCLMPSDAITLAKGIRLALEEALNLRTEYDEVRAFKKKADDAVKALQGREIATQRDEELVAMYRSLPGYVRLFTQPLKIRTELAYKYALAMLAYVSASRQEWKIHTYG